MLADATRVRIILALQGGELSVNTLATAVDKPPAAVSQHLAKLRLARIVATRHDGNRVFYRLATSTPPSWSPTPSIRPSTPWASPATTDEASRDSPAGPSHDQTTPTSDDHDHPPRPRAPCARCMTTGHGHPGGFARGSARPVRAAQSRRRRLGRRCAGGQRAGGAGGQGQPGRLGVTACCRSWCVVSAVGGVVGRHGAQLLRRADRGAVVGGVRAGPAGGVRRYTFGYGRVEDLAGLFIVAMIALSALIAG